VRIEDPSILKAGGFRLARERDDAVDRHVGLDGDAEVHVVSFLQLSVSIAAERNFNRGERRDRGVKVLKTSGNGANRLRFATSGAVINQTRNQSISASAAFSAVKAFSWCRTT
jgi:hypothetical protein